MATGTPFHARTAAHNLSLAWREWSGYFAATHYHEFHQPEVAAIRNGSAVFDVSPLLKYHLSGRDAGRLLDRVLTRNMSRAKVDQAIYGPWCNQQGHVLQEGTVFRLGEEEFQLNAAEPCQRWLEHNSLGLDVQIEDRSAQIAALAVQGPTSRELLAEVVGPEVAELGFFRLCRGRIAGAEVTVSRTGYTGDLGYELWMPADRALEIWDVLLDAGRAHGALPAGLLALDVSRVEAGFILIGVDYVPADQAKIPSQLSTPDELGMGWAVKLKKKVPFIGRDAILAERERRPAWRLVGLEVEWEPLEALYAEAGLMPDLPLVAWREAVPVYDLEEGSQIGRATSGCWSSLLKKLVAITTVDARYASPGTQVALEVTVDYCRRSAPATVVELPFFRPERMRG